MARQNAGRESSELGRGESSTRRLRVLIVDDNKLLLQTFERMFARIGLDPSVASDGQMAYDIAMRAAEPFDLIVSDFDMPDMNGLDLALRLKQSGSKAAFWLSSGCLTDVALSDAEAVGVSYTLYKPYGMACVREGLEACDLGADPTE